MAELTTSDVLSVEDGSSMEPPSREPSEGPEETVDGGTLKHRKKKKSRTILDGLQLSLKGHKQAFVSFTYQLSPLMEHAVHIDWKVLTAEGVECQHVRYHQLQPGDTLNDLASKYRKAHAVAIILVNTENSLELAAEFCQNVVRNKKTTFPLIVISSEDGKSLREFLNRHDPGELQARVESKNQLHVELQKKTRATGSSSPGSQSKSGSKLQRGLRKSLRFRPSARRGSINLKEELKGLVFPISGPLCVSADAGLFMMTMLTFYQHEEMMQREHHPRSEGAVFNKLNKHLDEMFARDFPFYLLVAYRVHKKPAAYMCEEMLPFINSCIDKFEKLEQDSIIKTMEAFLKIENVKIMFEANSELTVFQLLEDACLSLMEVRSSRSHDQPHRNLYCRMMWISVACKCRVERGARDKVDYWKQHLLTAQPQLQLNTDVIHSVKRGVEFGRLLQLPDEVAFTSQHMADVLIVTGTAKPLKLIREFVIVLEPFVSEEAEFVQHFLSRPRKACQPCFKQQREEAGEEGEGEGLRAIHPEGNLLAVLQEGLAFLDTVVELTRKRQWVGWDMDGEVKAWLSLLLMPVDITSQHAESNLKDFLTTKTGGATKQYREHIKREVIVKMEDNFGKLSVERFLRLYKAFLIWPNWVVEKYLRQYKIPKGVRICSDTWNEFFGEFVERFTDAQHHKFLLEFLVSVGQSYLQQGRARDFLLDLLHLDVPSLFVMETEEEEGSTSTLQSDILASSVPEEFVQFLADYIHRNSLQELLLQEVETIWGLVKEDSDFQRLILQVLQQELIPKSLSQYKTLSKPIQFLLKECVSAICADMHSLQVPSSRLTFCWGVVASCCQKMPLSEGLEWVSLYYSVIDQLGRIYSVYCSFKNMKDSERVIESGELPGDVTEADDNTQVFFRWILQAQKVLISWREKFHSKKVNYDDILMYTQTYTQIGRVAAVLSADSLVVDNVYLQAIKTDFLSSFEILNTYLLHYVRGHPENGWCSLQFLLSRYGVGLPKELLEPINSHIVFPGEAKSVAKKSRRLEHRVPASIAKDFQPGSADIYLEITQDLDLGKLKKLIMGIDSFLTPVERSLNTLTFFVLCESEIFDKYLKLQLAKLDPKPKRRSGPSAFTLPTVVLDKKEEVPQGVTVQVLGEALGRTKDLLLKLNEGTASYSDIIAERSLSLKSLDIDREFNILNLYTRFAKIDVANPEGLEGVKAMLQLFQYTGHIEVIHSVCDQYQLERCLDDKDLKELVQLVKILEEVENRDKLTAKDAIEKMETVSRVLLLEQKHNPKFLDLFSAVADSADFHQFIVTEKQFVGESGQALFQQQYELIKTQLQHEEYNEVVLNHLFAAFQFIMPFTDTEQSFAQLMQRVYKLSAYDARNQLDTVNRNINLIRLWFSRTEGDTLQGVAEELHCVLQSGYYSFVFRSTADSVSGTVELRYVPMASIYQNVGELTSDPGSASEQRLSDEQISDLVRKLGFLDGEGDVGYNINLFLHFNNTAKKLLMVYSKLRELGHPDYLQEVLSTRLPCSIDREEADRMVVESAYLLDGWEKEVARLRNEYDQLLFFSIPKMLQLYQRITADEPDYIAIVQNISFLFQNKPHIQKKLKRTIKELLASRPHNDSGSTPMHIVGAFLAALFSNFELSSYSLKKRRTSSAVTQSMTAQCTKVLYSCPGFTQSQLLRLIIQTYGGAPEVFEVFHCRPTTTEEELQLFLNYKRATKRPFQYLILEVNKLSYPLQEALLRLYFDLKREEESILGGGATAPPSPGAGQEEELDGLIPCVHYIETTPSLLQEMPGILHLDYKNVDPLLGFEEAKMLCEKSMAKSEDFSCIQLVYGEAGDGKTHYIERQLAECPAQLKIAVNEAFTPLSAIKKLCQLPTETPGCGVFFNFTLLPPGDSVDEGERQAYAQLVELVGWFFFNLFLLGYVEDPVTGHSFQFPGGMAWAVYVEVPSRNQHSVDDSLKAFFEDVPALGLLGSPYCVAASNPYLVDREVQLVCKYLKAYRSKNIDRLYKETGGPFTSRKPGVPVKFSLEPDLSDAECRKLLDRYIPLHMKKNKATQKLFVKYMKRRCEFLDTCPAFNFNGGSTEYLVNEQGQRRKNDTSQLGSTLMDTMLKEVCDFCDPIIRENWALKPHHQLIYDFKDGGGSFGLMSLHPDKIPEEDRERFKKIGVQIPSMLELYSRDYLDAYLSRVLDVPLDEHGRLAAIDDSSYVLTLDFAIKMLNIHERAECGVPVILEGETGVGKTALIEMLSKLWNFSVVKTWTLLKERVMDFVKLKLKELPKACLKSYPDCVEAIEAISNGTTIREDELMMIGDFPTEPGNPSAPRFYSTLRQYILEELVVDPLLSLLELRQEDNEDGMTVALMLASAQYKNNPKDTAKLLYKFLNANVKNTFHKLNVHAALQPGGILKFFQEVVFKQASELRRAYKHFPKMRTPFVTVFLDEVNTSSCLGLFKEVMIDKTLDGKPIPKNIFIISACNPHRGNSMAGHANVLVDTWIRGTYYVRQLHPTMQCLMWDYGALGEEQERDYILAKMKMSNKTSSNAVLADLTDLIVTSQNLLRSYALDQIRECGLTEGEASACSRSCVSQRDIQRVFTFFAFLTKMYLKYKPFGNYYDYSSRAVIVSLGLVYYLRLDARHRKLYVEEINHRTAASRLSFSKVFGEELDWYINQIDLPVGIAKTQALKENLFATIVCTMTHNPLIIVGSPGSSKTLSFNLALANLKGQESKVAIFRETNIFKALDPQMYQCSRRTTSNEIQTVFNRAINRQRSHQRVPLPVYCVVFMDEAGLPEERHESLKILHYFLDKQEVSFVAISNHVLDAAKTNRAVSLYRPEASQDDLVTLAKGCLCNTPDSPPPELKKDMEIVASFCPAYEALMNRRKLKRFFGLRDFIHFISYLRRKRLTMMSPQLVMEALERNFNGVSREDFQYISKLFLRAVHSSPRAVERRNILDILRDSLSDHPDDCGLENEMRYKLIIDPSEDGSLVRLLFSSGVLQRSKTRVYLCSDFPGDVQVQKVNTIAAIRHSATEGHTVVMTQTDSIHESFYDLFNRRFHRIDAKDGPRYYANVAIGAHIKPCRVHSDFECVLVVKESDVEHIPPPFLNRFEKYHLSHETVLEAIFDQLPSPLRTVFTSALEKTDEFLGYLGGSAVFYGLQEDTPNSLLLTLLPPSGFEYRASNYQPRPPTPPANEDEAPVDVKRCLLETLLTMLNKNAGFQIPAFTDDEFELDTKEVFAHMQRDSEFSGLLRSMTVEDAQGAVCQAMTLLYNQQQQQQQQPPSSPPPPPHKKEVPISTCLVLAVLTQWVIRHLCIKMMQLMTSGGLCEMHRKVPPSYIQAYLNHQHHFSLHSLLTQHYSLLQEHPGRTATKLTFFLHSTPLIHQLPSRYPNTLVSQPSSVDDFLRELVFTNTKQLMLYKLSVISAYTSVNELIKLFSLSETHTILLLVINMQETSKDVVNHLRIMIEEAETRYGVTKKLYGLLLHFPTSRLAVPCYPSIFLQGWDYHYLDVIGYYPKGGILDIRDWFRQCYNTSCPPEASVILLLKSLLREAIPVISARVFFGSHECSVFNKQMSIPERCSMLEQLFFQKGFGEILCERFNSYWQPSVMVDYLEKAVTLAQQFETTLTVIDSLQTIFQSLFFDFLVHMVSKINEGMNLDVLFNPESNTEADRTLFLDILRIFPIPKLSELKMLRITVSTLSKTEDDFPPPKFPFFRLVSGAVEKLVDQSRKDVNQHVDMLSGEHMEPVRALFQSAEQSKTQIMLDMLKIVESKLSDLALSDQKSWLSLAVHALLEEDTLWRKYLEDFTHQKLRLEFGNAGISHKVLRAAFGRLEERNALQRLAILHVYVHVHKLNLAKVVSILRPLDKIEEAVSLFPSMSEKLYSPTESFLENVEGGESLLGRPEALSVFIIDTLFGAVAGIARGFSTETQILPDRDVEQLKMWFKAYRDVMSMPTLREHIYGSRSVGAEAQHNVMHALFLVLRSRPEQSSADLQLGLRTYHRLFTQYFKPSMELQGECPRLESVATLVLEELAAATSSLELARDSSQLQHVVEGLLAHFFSEHQTCYNSSDVKWFLNIVNQQTQWQATYLMNEVIEVEYSVDLLSRLEFTPDSPTSIVENSIQQLAAHIPMSVFKFYLYRILASSLASSSEEPVHSVMLYFKKSQAHSLIAQVLRSSEDLGEPADYIPTFYQFSEAIEPCISAENQLMQQPLAHLYFLTVLEDLLTSDFTLSGLIRTSQNIEKQCLGGSVSEEEQVLLRIEEQAVVQVIIKQLAGHLHIEDSNKINALSLVLDDLNSILNDSYMGGGEVGGHGLVLAMHILREQQSFTKFVQLLTDHYRLLCDGIKCLVPFHSALTCNTPFSVPRSDQPVVLYTQMGVEFQGLYQRLTSSLLAIHSSHGGSTKVKDFTRLADECASGQVNITTPSGNTEVMSKGDCFKMALWLCIYNEFFAKKRPSQMLSKVLGLQMTKRLEPYFLQLLRCFLDPELLVRSGSTNEEPSDPLYNLFCPPTNIAEDPSDVDLRTALVHMVAVTIGCSPRNTHLWYHMFGIKELVGTYLTGFMYDSPVGPSEEFYYDHGVELRPEDGLYGKHDYIKHATRGTLSIHSLYLILWSSFAGFSLALLTQPSAEKELTGKVFSGSEPVRQYCATQLQRLWQLLRSGLGVCNEERLMLVQGCLNTLFELHLTSPSGLTGKLSTRAELDRYEKVWHSRIFTPCWKNLKKNFCDKHALMKNGVFKDILHLMVRYPWFPNVGTLTHSILSSSHFADPATNEVYPLSHFVLEYPRLKLCGDILPGIVELYQWLHTHLTYAVTYEDATTITLGRLEKVLAKHASSGGADRRAHYEKLKVAFNEYVHLTGCTSNKHPRVIRDDMPVLHLLSYSMDGEHGNDLLYTVISDMIKFHNQFLTTLLDTIDSSSVSMCYFPEEVPRVHVMEFSQQYMLVADSSRCSDLQQLIHKRSHLPHAFPTDPTPLSAEHCSNLPGRMSSLIDLHQLQRDILSSCIAGKPLIEQTSVSALKMPFMFKEDSSSNLTLRECAVDLEGIAEKLPQAFQLLLDEPHRKRLEYEFHSAGYHTIMEVITGFHTAIGHLINQLTLESSPRDSKQAVLVTQTLPQFLTCLYEYDLHDDSKDVFHEIGIHNLAQTQHECLEGLYLKHTCQALRLFVQWAEEGWYDFCTLPFAAKMPMNLPDEEFIKAIPNRYEGNQTDLLRELKVFIDLLTHLEASITKTLIETPQRPISKYLRRLQVCGNQQQDRLIAMIPDTVLLENYVSFRLTLRKLVTDMQSRFSRSELVTPEPRDVRWDDFVADLWDQRLPHFRQQGFVYSKATGTPPHARLLGEGDQSSILNELIHYSSETNLLTIFEEEPPFLTFPDDQMLSPSPVETSAMLRSDKIKEQLGTNHSLLQKLTSQVEAAELQERASRYSVQDVVDFLHSLSLDQYITSFEEYDISGELLIQASDDELKELGVQSALDRLKISVHFKRKVAGSAEFAKQCPPEMVASILEKHKPLKPFASTFLENGIDGELLLNASDEVMRELGIDKGLLIHMIRTKFKAQFA